MKKSFKRQNYASAEEVKTAMMKCLKEHSIESYEAEIHTLILRWNIAFERNGDSVEK